MGNIDTALEIAIGVHKGQVDKAGKPYILHVLRVMAGVSSPDEQIVAALHDVLEDGNYDVDELHHRGFSKLIVDAVVALTHQVGEEYDSYIKRVARCPLARCVKLADLIDNMDMSRISNPKQRDCLRLERYKRAFQELSQHRDECQNPCDPDLQTDCCKEYWNRVVDDGLWNIDKHTWTPEGWRVIIEGSR